VGGRFAFESKGLEGIKVQEMISSILEIAFAVCIIYGAINGCEIKSKDVNFKTDGILGGSIENKNEKE